MYTSTGTPPPSFMTVQVNSITEVRFSYRKDKQYISKFCS